MKNVCPCPKPPGGHATCPPDRLAICRIIDGEIQTDCLAPPDALGVLSRTEIANWVIGAALREERNPTQPLSPSDKALISTAVVGDGFLQTKDTLGAAVSFRLSEAMKKVLAEDEDEELTRYSVMS